MVNLFCFPVFDRKGRAIKSTSQVDMNSKGEGSDMTANSAAIGFPAPVRGPALQFGITTNSLSGQREQQVDVASITANEDSTLGKESHGVFVQPNFAVGSSVLDVCEPGKSSSESSRQLPKTSCKLLVDEVVFPVANTEASGQETFEKLYIDGTNNQSSPGEALRDTFFHYSPDEAILSLKCNKLAWEEDVLAEHASDPGVYQGEELPSSNGFSVIQSDGSVVHSLPLDASPNIDTTSHMSGEGIENLSEGSYGHCSEFAFDCLGSAYPSGNISQRTNVADSSPMCEEIWKLKQFNLENYGSITGQAVHVIATSDQKLKGKFKDREEPEGGTPLPLDLQSLRNSIPSAESSLDRVKEWISTMQQPDLLVYKEMGTSPFCIAEEDALSRLPEIVTVNQELARACTRNLSAYSTVAHMAGLGFKEVPSLGMFNCLKTLNLSGNYITRIVSGCLPQSLHSLDLSRNRLSQIDGIRDLTRLRVLNLSYNRISRIGHGLANCTLIKELYLAGNKMAEVDGLHRLLKLTVLDLHDNKIATSKALGQLAANYSTLLALNLLGNPILVNVGEDQLRKLISSLVPHVTYLNKQPIKAISVREAVVDNVARAALGSSQRLNKLNNSSASRAATRKIGIQCTKKQRSSHHRSKDLERKAGLSHGRHHHHHHRCQSHVENSIGIQTEQRSNKESLELIQNLQGKTPRSSCKAIHRSKSDGSLQDE